jgi:hypothetical protein
MDVIWLVSWDEDAYVEDDGMHGAKDDDDANDELVVDVVRPVDWLSTRLSLPVC